MDAITIIGPTPASGYTPATGKIPASASVALPQETTTPVPLTDSVQSASDQVSKAEQQRFQAMQQASQTAVMPLGDRRFTIFKDSNGQYITRYTSLKDGRITYVPEPEFLTHMYSPPALNIKA